MVVWSPEAKQTNKKKQKIIRKNSKVPKSPKFKVDFIPIQEENDIEQDLRDAYRRAVSKVRIQYFRHFL